MTENTTSCENCIWKISANGVQTGCKFGRVDKFEERNVEMHLEESDPIGLTQQTEKFYVIKRHCNLCRDSEWASWYDDPKAKVLEQIQIQYDVIIPITQIGVFEEDVKDYDKFIDRIMSEDKKPNSIHFVFHGSHKIGPYLEYYTKKFCEKDTNMFMTQVAEDDQLGMINHGVLKCTGMYYLVVDPQDYVTESFPDGFSQCRS